LRCRGGNARPSIVSAIGVHLARVYAAVSIPGDLTEAGRIDGAGEGRIFRTVALRIMSPSLVTMFLFQLVAIWKNFFLPLVMLFHTRLYPVTSASAPGTTSTDRLRNSSAT
jgi:multiple sugar transport system permease protein